MQEALILKALVVASGGIFSFGSILIVVALLGAHGGLSKALAYVGGNCGGYLIVGLGWFLLRDSFFAEPVAVGGGAGPVAGVGVGVWLRLGFGLLLLGLGLRSWSRTPEPGAAAGPSILTKVDSMRLRNLFGLGAMVSAINLKNIAIFLSALALLAEAELAFGPRVAALVAVIAVFCSSLILPIVLFGLFAGWATPRLRALRLRIEANMRPLSIAVACLFGSIFAVSAALALLSRPPPVA